MVSKSMRNLDSSNEKIDELITCSAIAHSSTANLGPGFDVFGLGLDAFEDVVTITRTNKMRNSTPQINLTCSGEGSEKLPSELKENSAGLVVRKMLNDFNLNKNANWDLDLHIVKKIPIGYGLGSSAASAAATALAVDGLFNLQLSKSLLIRYAAEGEIASAGTRHYDNVSGSLLGGFVIVTSTPEIDFIGLEAPEDLHLAIVVPLVNVPIKKTAVARGVLPKLVPLESVICNIANASTVVAGFALKNTKMVAKGISDVIIEPSRKHLIPGYELVKKSAIKAGALAVTISGAGPSMISILEDKKTAIHVANSMAQAFLESGVPETKTIICRPSEGAKILNVSK
jgi:homoserine kinase